MSQGRSGDESAAAQPARNMTTPSTPAGRPAAQRVLLATSSRRCVALPSLLQDPDTTAPAALEVLFLEDADLLGLAALPFSREVGLASGITRDLARHDIENALTRAARQIDADARALAQRLRSRYRFEVFRGRREEEILRRAAAADLALVEPRRERTSGAVGRVLVSLEADLTLAERALHVAYLLSGRRWARVTVFLPANAGAAMRDAVIRLTSAPGPTAETPRLRHVVATTWEDSLAELAAVRPDAMVLPLALGRSDPERWARWIATRDCLLALLR
jgi:hypothetical protein